MVCQNPGGNDDIAHPATTLIAAMYFTATASAPLTDKIIAFRWERRQACGKAVGGGIKKGRHGNARDCSWVHFAFKVLDKGRKMPEGR